MTDKQDEIYNVEIMLEGFKMVANRIKGLEAEVERLEAENEALRLQLEEKESKEKCQ